MNAITVADISTPSTSLFISANENSYVNMSECTFTKVSLTNQFKLSRAEFRFVRANEFKGLFIDSEQSPISFEYGEFNQFSNDAEFLLKGQDFSNYEVKHS